MSNFNNMPHFKFWCQKVLPLVYEDSLSYYELLCKVVAYLNNIIDDVNKIPEYINSLLNENILKDILTDLLNELREQIARANEEKSTTASANRDKDELVWLDGKLIRMTRDILAGDRYVEDTGEVGVTGNYVYTSIEIELRRITDLLQPTIDEINAHIGNLDELDTEVKTSLVAAINELVGQFEILDGSIGALVNLDTEDKSSIVNAINEIVDNIAKLDYVPCIDVTKYGLVADGVTDNYTAFNELYSEHKSLYFPEGTYYFSQPININQRASEIRGSGFNTIFKFDTDGILITNFYCEVSNIQMTTNGTNVYGIKLLASYAKIHDIWMYDKANAWFNNFIIGDVGTPVWFSLVENIYINDSNTTTKNGCVFTMTSTVNNIFTNIIITQKNKGYDFSNDKTAGYSTDGCQLNDLNITQTNQSFIANDCTAIYISHSIFDQITSKCFELTNCGNIKFDECYLSAGNSSPVTFKIGDIISSNNIRITNSQLSGAGSSSYGIVISSSNDVTIENCFIGYTVNGVTFSDANSTDCFIFNISFSNEVASKLFVQGFTNQYGLLKGLGTITVANALQCASIFNQGTFTIDDLGTGYYYDADIPLPAGMVLPIGIFCSTMNSDAFYICSYLRSTSPSGYARVRVRKADGTVFANENLTLSYIYAIA